VLSQYNCICICGNIGCQYNILYITFRHHMLRWCGSIGLGFNRLQHLRIVPALYLSHFFNACCLGAVVIVIWQYMHWHDDRDGCKASQRSARQLRGHTAAAESYDFVSDCCPAPVANVIQFVASSVSNDAQATWNGSRWTLARLRNSACCWVNTALTSVQQRWPLRLWTPSEAGTNLPATKGYRRLRWRSHGFICSM